MFGASVWKIIFQSSMSLLIFKQMELNLMEYYSTVFPTGGYLTALDLEGLKASAVCVPK